MPCNATSQLTNAPSVPLQVTMPTNNAQWAVFVQRLQAAINATRDAANRQPVNVVPVAYAVYNGSSLPALTVTGATAALDATKSQFGKASLKLTATAATVTVSFTGDPIAIQPFARWIESVYITSSRTSISGTLAVVTPTASYPVDISGTLLPATWGRLYGDCSLVADSSTRATMTLTLTGCSAGDTFNLEGWQLEQAAGNTNLPSAFVNSAAPGSQDTLPDGSGFVRLSSSHASGNVAYNYRGVWASVTAYVTGDEVVYSGSYWLCLTGNTSSAPAQGNGNWQVVGAYNNYQGAWSSTTTYYAGQETTYNGNYWVAAATNTNSAPSVSNANWVVAGPQNLDKIADGTGRFAVVNGGNLKGVSSVDTNNRAGIDFTQSLHVGKSLANIPDDPTSTRYAVSNIDGNRRALVDATQAGHVGAWNLDSRVVDGTNFQRVGTGYADSSGRIVNLWDGVAVRSAVNTWDGANRARTGLDSSGIIVAGMHPVDNLKDGTYARMKASSMTGNDFDFAKGGVNRNMGYVPDGGGRYGVHAVDGNNLALIDFSQSGHVHKTQDYIPAGSSYGRAPITYGTHYALTIPNADFSAPLDPQGAIPGLIMPTSNGSATLVGSPPSNGASNYVLITNTAASGNWCIAYGAEKVPCTAGDVLSANVWMWPGNATGTTIIGYQFCNAAGTQVGTVYLFGTPGNGWENATVTGTAPANTAYAQRVYGVLASSTPNQYAGFSTIRASLNDVRVAGSGAQIGDQRNAPPIASANLRSTWTGQSISYSATAGTPATATISVTAATLLMGGTSVAYNAMSVGVTGTNNTNVTFYLYLDDPTYAGGAQTLVATTANSAVYSANGRVYVGACTVGFPSSGSGSGAGQGGGGACVALGSFGPQGRFDDTTRIVVTPSGDAGVRKLKTSHQKCVRVEYDNGTVLTCSEDAPLMDGQRKVLAVQALGEILDTSEGPSRVCSVECAGILEVVSIDAGDVAYYAGVNPDGPFALHHNKIIP